MNSGTKGALRTISLAAENWRVMETLFDHVPDTVFFVKDHVGRYVAVNRTFVERCGFKDKTEITGRTVREIFPAELAARYAAQDEGVLRTSRPVLDRLELHWRSRRRRGWCLTTKLPLVDSTGKTTGLVGISRDLDAPGDAAAIPESLAEALAYLDENFGDPITPASLAAKAKLPPSRFARIIKRIFQVTPGQWITQTRLAAAARLLETGDLGIAEVAIECGFYDHSAFTRAFRSATGQTPSQFRSHFR